MLTIGTWNQLRFTEKNRIPIGLRFDYRSSISKRTFPRYLKVDGQEMFWATKHEYTVNQSYFNSLGLQFMHFKSPELNWKTNPYKVMKVWVDIGGPKKTPMFGVQQIYKDTVRCKLIGTEEQIAGVKANKKFEEDFTWQDELARIQKWNREDIYTFKNQVKKMSNNSGGIEFVEVTSLDDYAMEYDIYTDWKSFEKEKYAVQRMRYLEEVKVKIESRIGDMSERDKKIFSLLAEEYQVVNYDIDERWMMAEKSMYGKSFVDIMAEKFETHPGTIWKAYWVYIEPWVNKEMEFIENLVL